METNSTHPTSNAVFASHVYKPRSVRARAFFMAGLFLFLAAILFLYLILYWVRGVNAATPTYDPYADSVVNSSAGVVNADNAVGAPNGTTAQMVGANAILTLDMGAGEEGTQTLKVYFGQVNALVNATVDFLDSNQSVITSRSVQLGIDPNPSTQNFEYNWTNYGKAYRFVRLSSTQAAAGVNIDAVEALGYIGSTATQDTDGDGVPDRTEQQNGTNPLVADAPVSSNGTSPATTGSTTLKKTSTPNGASAQINSPPAANNDKDGDGMADDWELAHGLDPNDKSDAAQDPDHDGLTNLQEYQLGSDPHKADTDGDGMPDGWEFQYGLDLLKNDATGDPDGDHLTNLGEYIYHTNPQRADDLYKVFNKPCAAPTKRRVSDWEWGVFAALLLGAAVSWLMAVKNRDKKPSHKPPTAQHLV